MRKLYRSMTDKKIAGVCGGIAKIYNIDSTLVRLVFVLLFLLTGFFPIGLLYIVAWIIMPISNDENKNISE